MATSSHPPISTSIVASVTPQSTTPTGTSSEHGSDSGNGAGATAGAACTHCQGTCTREDHTHMTLVSRSHRDRWHVTFVAIWGLCTNHAFGRIVPQLQFQESGVAGGALNSAPARLALPPGSRSRAQPSMPLSADASMGMEDTLRCRPCSSTLKSAMSIVLQESLCLHKTLPPPA